MPSFACSAGRWALLTSCLGFLLACQPDPSPPQPSGPCAQPVELSQLTTYEREFLDIAFGNEFGDDYAHIRKWAQSVRIHVPEFPGDSLLAELERIVNELNELSETVQLLVVDDPSQANFTAYFGTKTDYAANVEPSTSSYASSNFGLFYVRWNSRYEIIEGSLCVDIEREDRLDCQKHLLREELTQALGLFNDTEGFPESIFHQQYTCSPSYSEQDKAILRTFLSNRVEAGMCQAEVLEVL